MRPLLRCLFGLLFIAGGVMHFVRPEWYVKLMPPYLPWHRELIAISGVFEVLLGAMLLVPRFHRLAAWGLIALLIAIFPANVHCALHPDLFPDLPPLAFWLRLPLQGLLIAWAAAYIKRP